MQGNFLVGNSGWGGKTAFTKATLGWAAGGLAIGMSEVSQNIPLSPLRSENATTEKQDSPKQWKTVRMEAKEKKSSRDTSRTFQKACANFCHCGTRGRRREEIQKRSWGLVEDREDDQWNWCRRKRGTFALT